MAGSLRPEKVQRLKGTKAFSLLEIMISMPILAIAALALVSVLIFASRQTRICCNEIAAKHIAQRYFERMAIDAFEDVTPANYPSVTLASSPPLYLDHVNQTRCAVNIRITGYGTAESGSASSLTDSDAAWESNEWAGDTLLLVGGTGRGQRAAITGNTATALNVSGTFDPAPDATTAYLINGGKTVRITTLWTFLDRSYEATIESLVIDWGPRR